MPRRQRIHVPDGMYYVFQSGDEFHPIFSGLSDYLIFEELLQVTLRRYGTRLHAYCWTAETFHIILEIGESKVGHVMQDLNSRYARRMQQRTGKSGPFFRRRYRSILIDPGTYLVKLINYLHYVPVLAGIVRNPDEYGLSSHATYLNRIHVPWVYTRTALQFLDSFDEDRIAYRKLMSVPPQPAMRHLFECGDRKSPGVLASPEFMENLPRAARRYRARISLDQVTDKVISVLEVPRERVLSKSRRRDLALARALITWYATERRAASLLEVARYLHRSPSTLSAAVSRYSMLRPELFTLDVFQHLAPLVMPRNISEPLAEYIIEP